MPRSASLAWLGGSFAGRRTGLRRYLRSAGEIEERFPDFIVIRMYRAACGQMKALLSAKAEDIRARLLRTVAAEAMERNQATKARFDAIIEKLQEEPQVRPAVRPAASRRRGLVVRRSAAGACSRFAEGAGARNWRADA